ncbi:TetR/AcrR family transcriptional regulator [Streptomyces sp. FH025]|uniref:TetR/AcrR family transcriptional regulator n=1 Tax=Streptomyces sp. FH025 TaxID=2815937 RepID=UPI001A9FB1D1|nr:TetR/AcrR family transcriptional regulator [Streptomyces sp. FH025]MBO1417640.1 TetR/AcrR family transcriptional regulator [Streptomyces sp. FH025]
MPKSPTKRRPLTVAALNDSALALFLEHGFHATSIRDIVARAGLTRGAFYSNYQDKEQLFLALYDQQIDKLLDDLGAALRDVGPGGDLPSRLLRELAGRRREDEGWFLLSMEFTLHAARHPEVARGLAEHEARLIDGLVELIERMSDQDPQIRPRDLARLLVILHEGATAMRLTEEARGELAEFPEDLLHRVVDGLFHPADR